ncbi:hypothetical protein [Bradyrhizobium septentrionale]|uniref:Transcriptional regulator n=1 Tax=Bradyrhizobium septentrionale TaxID=1404411 RepID=A0ABZ2P1A4_9BRAD
MDQAALLVDTVCRLAGSEDLISAKSNRLRQAILNHDTPQLFKQLLEAFSLQGISDHAARSYMDHHDSPAWHDLQRATSLSPACSKLRSYWSFHGCGYRKDGRTCAEPGIACRCSLPQHDLRNGRLNQTTYSLFLFIRDVAGGNLVEWIDQTLDQASLNGTARYRVSRMRRALIDPLRNVFGVSDKLLNMALADILMAAPSNKLTWLEAGSGMIAIDTLVHNFLLRTGIQRRLGVQHRFGPACYGTGGCADIIARIAPRIDASQYNPGYPRIFPRFVQHALWRWCAQLELGICNGNNIDDRFRCDNKGCPLFHRCERVVLND